MATVRGPGDFRTACNILTAAAWENFDGAFDETFTLGQIIQDLDDVDGGLGVLKSEFPFGTDNIETGESIALFANVVLTGARVVARLVALLLDLFYTKAVPPFGAAERVAVAHLLRARAAARVERRSDFAHVVVAVFESVGLLVLDDPRL